MCTLTMMRVGSPDGVRLGYNRDVWNSRPPALPPTVRRFGTRQAILPLDQPSGGTWLGANDAGLALALLNVYPGAEYHPAGVATRGRGDLVPLLLHLDSAPAALNALRALDPTRCRPFLLVAVDSEHVAWLRWDGRFVTSEQRSLATDLPLLFTTCGVGDQVVQAVRRGLFAQYFLASPPFPARQDAFHRHQWPLRPDLSVCLDGGGAYTASYTAIELGTERVLLDYYDRTTQPPLKRQRYRLPRAVPALA